MKPVENSQREASALSSLQLWRKRISTGMDQVLFNVEILIFSHFQLLPGLYVGGLRYSKDKLHFYWILRRDAIDTQQLVGNKIRAIISVHGFTKECDFGGVKVDVLRVMLNDSPGENVLRHFVSTNSFIHAHRLRQGASKCFVVTRYWSWNLLWG